MSKPPVYTACMCCLALSIPCETYAGVDAAGGSSAEARQTVQGASPDLFDEPAAVQHYLLAVEAAHARAFAAVLDKDVPSAEIQAGILAANLRVLNAAPIDTLPEEHQSYIKGLREIRNDIMPGIVAAFLAVASGELPEEELTQTLAPLEAELYEREESLAASHPVAAASMGSVNAQLRSLSIHKRFMPEGEPEVRSPGLVGRKERAERCRQLAERIEEYLKTRVSGD